MTASDARADRDLRQLSRWLIIGLALAGLLAWGWWANRPDNPPGVQPYSQETQARLFDEHDCTRPRDAVPGLAHYAVIRHYTEPEIAVVELGTELDRFVDLGSDTGKDWYVVGLCRR